MTTENRTQQARERAAGTMRKQPTEALKARLYAALKHSKGCSCGECSGGLNAVDALADRVAALETALDSIIVRCEEGDKRTDWLPIIASIARSALEGAAAEPEGRRERHAT